MHKIVYDFVNTNERLAGIVSRLFDKTQYLESTFNKLANSISFENIEQKIYDDLDQAIVKGHQDSNLYLLFVSFAITFTCIRSQVARAVVIQSIGSKVLNDKILPEVVAYYKISVADLKFHEGKYDESAELAKESFSLIDKNNPRFVTILAKAAHMAAKRGRLNEIDKQILKIGDSNTDEVRAMGFFENNLINNIYTGNFEAGFNQIEEYKKKFDGKFLINISDYIDSLKILSCDFDSKNYENVFFKFFADALNLLYHGNVDQALKVFNRNTTWVRMPNVPFYQYFQLHAELSLKNIGKAKLLIQEIDKNGKYNYIDDFFLVRLQMLENNQDAACNTFSRLMDNLKRFDAMNRLHFELKFAKEFQASDLLFLMNHIKNNSPLKLEEKAEISIRPSVVKGIKLLIGESEVILQVKKLIKKYSGFKDPVLITGETGTGKELVARAIHDEGANFKEPFLAINCSSLSESLLESELFGYEAGAFTGAHKAHKGILEIAGKGTVFLDEFGEISSKMQASLLRVLESKEIRKIGSAKTQLVECKMVIATNVDLQKAVEEKRFREDLFFRINRFDIQLPPLRDRLGDLPKLIIFFLNSDKKKDQKIQITSRLLEALKTYSWPGNIRELKNEIERLKILHEEKTELDLDDFDFDHLQNYFVNQQVNRIVPKIDSQPIVKSSSVIDERIAGILNKGSKMNQRQEMLKNIFRENKKLKRFQVMEIAQISAATATKDLSDLCKIGFIEKKMPTKSVRSHYYAIIE